MTATDTLDPEHSVGLQHGQLPGRMLAIDVGASGESETWLDPEDPIFAVHFPEWPVLPGSFVLRTALATAAVVEHADNWQLRDVKRITFRKGVRPGQILKISVNRSIGLAPSYTFVASAGTVRIGEGAFTIIPVGAA